MTKSNSTITIALAGSAAWPGARQLQLWFLSAAVALLVGCGSQKMEKKNNDFFTSGSREADQRASQRMAKAEQLGGSGEGAGEKGAKKAKPNAGAPGSGQPAQVEGKLALFDRLGGEEGIIKIVDDFTTRALQDPRVNWE